MSSKKEKRKLHSPQDEKKIKKQEVEHKIDFILSSPTINPFSSIPFEPISPIPDLTNVTESKLLDYPDSPKLDYFYDNVLDFETPSMSLLEIPTSPMYSISSLNPRNLSPLHFYNREILIPTITTTTTTPTDNKLQFDNPIFTNIYSPLGEISPRHESFTPYDFKNLYSNEEKVELMLEEMRINPDLRPFWFDIPKKYTDLMNYLDNMFLEEFKDIGICIPQNNVEFNLNTNEIFISDDSLFTNKVNKCIRSKKIKIIFIYFGILNSMMIDGELKTMKHANFVIINKSCKSIEFYDPNGWNFHLKTYGTIPNKILMSYFVITFSDIRNYEYYGVEKTCPKFGPQVFQSQFKSYENILYKKGLCILWSFFIFHLRMKYYEIEPKNFKQKIVRMIKKLNDKEFIFDSNIEYDTTLEELNNIKLQKMFNDFIMNYMIYIYEKNII